ncbi:MAG: 2-amino-4-hydroxy-6-hydroxymethyldihydropteridine diphosphokinase [Actinomycetia bacterium]|nr:2-amino-4-hydroxy-6-hydroxymethyldihydropteridine diphosphokinase [Actinomycetes bacterium]
MQDEIRISGISATGFHGVLSREQAHGQTFLVDIVLRLDLTAAAQSDDLTKTVDYGAVCEQVVARITEERYELIETLAGRIADDCLMNAAVVSATVAVHKPDAPVAVRFADISVTVHRTRPPHDFGYRVALGIGANLGDRIAALQYACRELPRRLGSRSTAISPIYETDPVGGPQQPDYLNCVLILGLGEPGERPSATLPQEILQQCHEVEAALNRTREVRWGPRTLDVDILALGNLEVAEPDLQIPHPRLYERAFVLTPWADVDPGFAVPGAGRVDDLLQALPRADRAGVRPFPGG